MLHTQPELLTLTFTYTVYTVRLRYSASGHAATTAPCNTVSVLPYNAEAVIKQTSWC